MLTSGTLSEPSCWPRRRNQRGMQMNRLIAKSRFPEDKKPLPRSQMQEFRDKSLPVLRILEERYQPSGPPGLLKKLEAAQKGIKHD